MPAVSRKGAMEAPGGQLDFLYGSLNLDRQGEQIPLRANRAGHCILIVVDFCGDPSRIAPCPEASASFFASVQKAPDLLDGGLHLPYTPDGLYHVGPPLAFAACKAVSPGDAVNWMS